MYVPMHTWSKRTLVISTWVVLLRYIAIICIVIGWLQIMWPGLPWWQFGLRWRRDIARLRCDDRLESYWTDHRLINMLKRDRWVKKVRFVIMKWKNITFKWWILIIHMYTLNAKHARQVGSPENTSVLNKLNRIFIALWAVCRTCTSNHRVKYKIHIKEQLSGIGWSQQYINI